LEPGSQAKNQPRQKDEKEESEKVGKKRNLNEKV
jgi:hypothetical protein